MIYITGVNGYIGTALARYLDSVDAEYISCTCDITKSEELKSAKFPQIDTVVHLAGHIDISLPLPAKEGLDKLYGVNVLGAANILEFCLDRDVKCLIFISSQSVYGIPAMQPLIENSPCVPMEHYAVSKYCAEKVLQIARGLHINVLRLPGVYSECRRKGVVYNFSKQAIEEGHIKVCGDFPLPLDIIHLDDVINAIYMAINYQAGYSCFNISTGEPCSLDILADTIAKITGCTVTHSKTSQPVVQLQADKAKNKLRWQAKSMKRRLTSYLQSLSC